MKKPVPMSMPQTYRIEMAAWLRERAEKHLDEASRIRQGRGNVADAIEEQAKGHVCHAMADEIDGTAHPAHGSPNPKPAGQPRQETPTMMHQDTRTTAHAVTPCAIGRVRVTGHEALRRHGEPGADLLRKYADPITGAGPVRSVMEAESILAADPGLLYVDLPEDATSL